MPQRRGNWKPEGNTRAAVAGLYQQGLSLAEIARALGISKPTVSYHARKLGIPPVVGASRRYDWNEVQAYYDTGRSIRQCCAEFGFSKQAWYQAVQRGLVRPRPRVDPLTRYLVVGKRVNRFHLKTYLFNAGSRKTGARHAASRIGWVLR